MAAIVMAAEDVVLSSTLTRLAAARFPLLLGDDDCPNSVMAMAAINRAFASIGLGAASLGLVPSDEDTRDGMAWVASVSRFLLSGDPCFMKARFCAASHGSVRVRGVDN